MGFRLVRGRTRSASQKPDGAARRVVLASLAAAFAISAGVAVLILQGGSPADLGKMGSINKLERAYLAWQDQHLVNGGDGNVLLGLGWSKAYSPEFTEARGVARLDLFTGLVDIHIEGRGEQDLSDVWIVENVPGEGRSDRPEQGDRAIFVGTLSPEQDGVLQLQAHVGSALAEMVPDAVVVSPAGKGLEEGLLFGSPILFQRLHTLARLGRLDSERSDSSLLTQAHASALVPSFDPLIEQGAELFFNETFNGNGRTCGTCHPAEHNFTIDPEFIATLPDNDPLFVAEFVPALANNFEKPALMRKLGLILENTNGFGDLANSFTMRSVPHTLALPTSLAPAPFIDGSTIPPVQRTGWSGDGSPGDGSLRSFAQGAITQHFPLTTARVPNSDFRLATSAELDAMEAFQLFLGRDADVDLSTLSLKNEVAARGLVIFNTGDTQNGTVAAGKCSACHFNAGANVGAGVNANFNTGVEDIADQPGDLIDPANNPPDDGFGNPGNGSFNTPPLVEAADTGPFFHNNAVETLEQAVAFYNSAAFNNSPSGQFLSGIDSGGIGIRLEATQVVAVSAFLRVLNALENIRSADETSNFVKGVSDFQTSFSLLRQAIAEVDDGIEVLDCGGLHPVAQRLLLTAKIKLELAAVSPFTFLRNPLIDSALNDMSAARGDMVN